MVLSRSLQMRLLQAAQGSRNTSSSLRLRSFPLRKDHISLDSVSFTPRDFHEDLCQRIREAKDRVHLASLYVGPAADPRKCSQEVKLLEALRATECPDVRILLDQSRALRKVPTPSDGADFITSAGACYQALKSRTQDPEIYLFSVLPNFLQYTLSNPYDEVAGVFHLKVYIVDDSMVLSGANLSEEYFVDRVDRYLLIQNGGNGLVDCYADLVNVLCQHSNMYKPIINGDGGYSPPSVFDSPMDRKSLVHSVSEVLATGEDVNEHFNAGNDSDVVAYAVPTFQSPAHFFSEVPEKEALPCDADVIENILKEATVSSKEDPSQRMALRLSSAYLNLTDNMREIIASTQLPTHLLTAGRLSHGFKPKKKAGNKGKEWIPTVFEELAREMMRCLKSARLWYYQREGWTFHAKGIWLSVSKHSSQEPLEIEDPASLALVTHGSSNYGARSTYRDLESNLLLVFSPGDEGNGKRSVQEAFTEEWNRFSKHAQDSEEVAAARLQWPFGMTLPLIKPFF